MWPWVTVLDGFYDAAEHLDLVAYPNVGRWLAAAKARPASEVGQNVPPMSDA